MSNDKELTLEEKELAHMIITHSLRTAATEYPFLQKPLYALRLYPYSEMTSIGADYNYLYYNPAWVISFYQKCKNRMPEVLIHCVLHSLLLHQSMRTEKDELFDAAADASAASMMKAAYALTAPASVNGNLEKLINITGSTSAADIYNAAQKDSRVKAMINAVSGVIHEDDHSIWFDKPPALDRQKEKKRNGKSEELPVIPPQEDNGNSNSEGKPQAVSESDKKNNADAQDWANMLKESKSLANKAKLYGNCHGGMFEEVKKPSRFSRFSYREYLKRFAMNEIVSEDPESIDHALYTWGIENLGDIPIVEFSETKEQSVATDIIIAIDVSGSCSGETAANFLRQIYTLFTEMDIRSTVNINVITFDTEIIDNFVIRSAGDSKKLIREYEPHGWGGTDFICVFDYADKYKLNNKGKRLKGLFFFSDAYGNFPESKPRYTTTFFVPQEDFGFESYGGSNDGYEFVPDWVELVKYRDD